MRLCRCPVLVAPVLLLSLSAAAESPPAPARPAPTPPAKAPSPGPSGGPSGAPQAARAAACTVESVQKAGEFCAPCANFMGSQGRCDHAFAEAEPAWEYRCRSAGQKRWNEVWCRPWTKPGRPPVPSPEDGAATPATPVTPATPDGPRRTGAAPAGTLPNR